MTRDELIHLLSGKLTNTTVNSLIDLIAGKATDVTINLNEKFHCESYRMYLVSTSATFEEIEASMTDYAFRLYFHRIFNAEYRALKKGPRLFLNGFIGKFRGESFVDSFLEEVFTLYRKATVEINFHLLSLIQVLDEENLLTKEQQETLIEKYILPTHVCYERMWFPNPSGWGNLTIINVLRTQSADDINAYYGHRYAGYDNLCKPCKGQVYRYFMRYLKKNKILVGREDIYK